MENSEKEACANRHRSHCFPSMEGESIPQALDTADSSRNDNTFRPLFQSSDGDAARRAAGNAQSNLETVREESYSKGFEAGKIEACQRVQKELQKPVSQFLTEKEQFGHCFTRISDDYSNHIVGLALSIAKKILGPTVELDMDQLEPICRQVHACLTRRYRLTAKMNPEDMASLNQVLACSDSQWHQSAALEIIDDSDTRKGHLDLVEAEETMEPLKDLFSQSFKTTLTEAVSTK